MALRWRQIQIYTDRCTIYRRNKAKGADGQWTFTLLASGVVCKHFTRPNFDTDSEAGGYAQTKESNIFTSDQLHVDQAQDIQAEDVILMTTSPVTPGKMRWYRVCGEPMTRGGIANRSEVFLAPCGKPVIV